MLEKIKSTGRVSSFARFARASISPQASRLSTARRLLLQNVVGVAVVVVRRELSSRAALSPRKLAASPPRFQRSLVLLALFPYFLITGESSAKIFILRDEASAVCPAGEAEKKRNTEKKERKRKWFDLAFRRDPAK